MFTSHFLVHGAVFFYLLSIALSAAGRYLPSSRAAELQKAGLWAVFPGALSHLAALATLGLEKGRFPAASPAESLLLVSFFAVAMTLALQYFYGMRRLGMFVLPLAAAMALIPLHVPLPAETATHFGDPLFVVHTALVMLAAALLLGHVATSVLYIWQEASLKRRRLRLSALPMPSLDVCDRIGTRMLGWGFLCLTLGILTGAVWAARTNFSAGLWRLADPEISLASMSSMFLAACIALSLSLAGLALSGGTAKTRPAELQAAFFKTNARINPE